MIRFTKAPVATSVQDQGRFGLRHLGLCRSGAMDPISARLANRLAGARDEDAVIEMGPGSCEMEVTAAGTISFGGASRDGAPWWRTIDVAPGDRFRLSQPIDGLWSYLAMAGGVDSPVIAGSRSTCVREGIGGWINPGDTLFPRRLPLQNSLRGTHVTTPPEMTGPIRVFGDLGSGWSVGTRIDRMGYALEGPARKAGAEMEWSEPIPVGAVQITPSGGLFVMMAEGSTVGGYELAAVVHSDDLRLLAQSKPGTALEFIPLQPL